MSNEHGAGYVERKEHFDVVLLKKDVSEMAAKPEDFKRVAVVAPDPLRAQQTEEVAKVIKEGYRPLAAVPPMVQIDAEIHARRRAIEGHDLDRSKI